MKKNKRPTIQELEAKGQKLEARDQEQPIKISKRPTIAELEAILNAEGEETLEILPNGEVRRLSKEEIANHPKPKPLTMKEELGGEYALGPVMASSNV